MASIVGRPASHSACRTSNQDRITAYQVGKDEEPIYRPFIPSSKLSWDVEFREYKPIHYTSPIVLANPPWADPDSVANIKWNSLDNQIDRRSYMGEYGFDKYGIPLNPVGRTGITGRGLLGRWGPNHAADPIVTRWKLNENGDVERDARTNRPILQFVSIQRLDTGEWAIPGGMCDPGEKISMTMKREFMEEALNSNEMDRKEYDDYKMKLSNIFSEGIEVYRGYVDDPRNTDNSWMETVAYNFHDHDNMFKKIKLTAGDDAKHVNWRDIDSTLQLYASHKHFILQVANRYSANW